MAMPPISGAQASLFGNHARSVRKLDPIMEELYAVRAKLNAEAGYSVERLIEIVRRDAQQLKAKSGG